MQITPIGRRLVRAATSEHREKPLPAGTLREWHWKALALAWAAHPSGIQADVSGYYGNTWQRLRDYLVKGERMALVKEYQTAGYYDAGTGMQHPLFWIRLTVLGERFYHDYWECYRELYPGINAPEPDLAAASTPAFWFFRTFRDRKSVV